MTASPNTPGGRRANSGGAGQSPPRSRWLALGLGAFMLTMIAAMVFGLNAGTRLGSRYTPLLDSIFHVKLNVTTAHLWFEEAISGDTNESIEDVRNYLETAQRFVEYALSGGKVDMFTVTLLSQPDLRGGFEMLAEELRRLAEITEERWDLSRDARAGSSFDENYDRVFRGIIAMADEIEAGLEAAVVQETETFRRVQIALIIASTALFGFTLWLTRRQILDLRREIEQRRETEQNLLASEAAALAARDEADSANRAKSLFLAKISHEIRTPISAVMGMATMLSDSSLDREQREFTRIIQTSSNDLLEIINDLLDFSKIEVGKLALAPVKFDLRKTVADIADMMNLHAREKEVALRVSIPADFPPRVTGDPVRIRQILLNLVRNAVKFTERGTIGIALEGQRERGDRLAVRLSVSDTGIGIPADKLEQIFEAFSQVDDSSTRRFGGTGLGLSICRQLAELMNGRMGVESEPGRGTRFWVDIPLQVDQPSVEFEPLRFHDQPVRVLLADPDLDNARCTAAYLEAHGVRYEIATEPELVAETVAAALRNEDRYQALIISHPFEHLDLEALCDRLHGDSQLAETRIIILTISPLHRLTRQFADCGIDGITTQARRALVLRDMLEQVLADPGSRRGRAVMIAGPREDLPDRPRRLRPQFKARVLLVEDNPVTQWAAKHMLSTMGCRVDVAGNGREALEMWGNTRYDLVFMDWQMPDMDGIDVTTRIRKLEAGTAHTPIVAITANAMLGDREICLEAGMDDYLSKPVQPEGLQRILETYVPAGDSARGGDA